MTRQPHTKHTRVTREQIMSNELNTGNSLADKLAALAKLQAEQRSKAGTLTAVALPGLTRNIDAFGSPIGAGTNALHVTLAEAYAQGAWLDRKGMIALSGYTNTPNHLNTMRLKGRVVAGERGQWRLSDTAAAIWHGDGKPFAFATMSATSETPAETNEVAQEGENVANANVGDVANSPAETNEVMGPSLPAETGDKPKSKGKRRGE